MQTDCPFELKLIFWARFKDEDSMKNAEEEMHLKYKEKNTRGEWFFFVSIRYVPASVISVQNFLTRLHGVIETSTCSIL